jgi:hypothetical protein
LTKVAARALCCGRSVDTDICAYIEHNYDLNLEEKR